MAPIAMVLAASAWPDDQLSATPIYRIWLCDALLKDSASRRIPRARRMSFSARAAIIIDVLKSFS